MKLKIEIAAEDHANRVKKTVAGELEVPNLLQGNPRDRVKKISEWCVNTGTAQLNGHFGGPNPFRSSMKLCITIVAEDYQARLKSTHSDAVSVPEDQLMEGNARDRVRQLAGWAFNQVVGVIAPQLDAHQPAAPGYGHQPGGFGGGGNPIDSMITERRAQLGMGRGPLQLPGSPAPAQAYGGWQPGRGNPPPYMGAGAPTKGTAAPIDPRRIPRDERQAVSQSTAGLRRANADDRRSSRNIFVIGDQNKEVKVERRVGWGPHRSK